MRVFKFNEIDSTNRYLKSKVDKEDFDCVIAKRQTAGVGRRGNTWVSNEGMALFSFAVHESNIDEENYMKVPLITGIVLLETLKKLDNLDIMFKWTNDLYIHDKKLSGILIEKTGEWFIIGIGININNMDFGYANDRAISLKKITGKTYDVDSIITEMIYNFKESITHRTWNEFLDEINHYNFLKSKEIEITKGSESIGRGIAQNIAENGTLEVLINNKIKNFSIGEIHIKR